MMISCMRCFTIRGIEQYNELSLVFHVANLFEFVILTMLSAIREKSEFSYYYLFLLSIYAPNYLTYLSFICMYLFIYMSIAMLFFLFPRPLSNPYIHLFNHPPLYGKIIPLCISNSIFQNSLISPTGHRTLQLLCTRSFSLLQLYRLSKSPNITNRPPHIAFTMYTTLSLFP